MEVVTRRLPLRRRMGYRRVEPPVRGYDGRVDLGTDERRFAEPLRDSELLDGEESLTTPFEDWCEATRTHPEAPGAWELFISTASSS
jgi:hypothetical protein